MSVAEQVRELAKKHGVSVPVGDAAFEFAVAINRLEDVHGDETLVLISQLAKHEFITFDEAAGLCIQHTREVKRQV